MKTVILDAQTLGGDIDLSCFSEIGETKIYDATSAAEIAERISDCEVVVLNKAKIGEKELDRANNLKLICITATGFDNVDVEACKKRNIAVCNVKGYSTDSVMQTTLAIVFSLVMHIPFYDNFVKSGEYTKSGMQNRLTPTFCELSGKKWGIVGYGGIGSRVARVAEALGCEVAAFSKTPKDGVRNVDIDTLCKESDIITVHLPLNEQTRHIIGEKQLNEMKPTAILVNAARGAVLDEAAVCKAVKEKKLAGFGTDVYSVEPLQKENPISELSECDNVILTPHLAWGAYEARVRCVREVIENIKSFEKGEKRNRVD